MYRFGNLQARPGQFVIFDPLGFPVRVVDIVTSWAAKTCRVENDGSLNPIN